MGTTQGRMRVLTSLDDAFAQLSNAKRMMRNREKDPSFDFDTIGTRHHIEAALQHINHILYILEKE